MKSTEFITEREVISYQSSVLGVDDAVAMLNAHCRQSLAMIHTPLWRGMRNHRQPIISIDPSTGLRQSENTSNYYTVLMDNSPYFAGWPKRSRSLVCSTSRQYANAFADEWGDDGVLYAIFPSDGVKIAVCPGKDMWDTTIKLPRLGVAFGKGKRYGDMSVFNNVLQRRFRLPDAYALIQQAVKTPEFAERLASFIHQSAPAEQKNSLQPGEFLDYLQQQMAPANTGFELMSIADFSSSPPKNRECWVSGPVVAIRQDMYKKFLSAVKKSSVPNKVIS